MKEVKIDRPWFPDEIREPKRRAGMIVAGKAVENMDRDELLEAIYQVDSVVTRLGFLLSLTWWEKFSLWSHYIVHGEAYELQMPELEPEAGDEAEQP